MPRAPGNARRSSPRGRRRSIGKRRRSFWTVVARTPRRARVRDQRNRERNRPRDRQTVRHTTQRNTTQRKEQASMKASAAELDEAISMPHPDRTPSGLHVPVVVGPDDAKGGDGVGAPGEFPFTRGIFPDGYRGRLWTMRQYSGFGTAEESNEPYRF